MNNSFVRIKRKHLKKIIMLFAVILLISITVLFLTNKTNTNETSTNKNIYSYYNGSMSYSQDREIPKFKKSFNHSEESYDVYNIDFTSRNFINFTTHIYGLLFMPKNGEKLPGVVLLPGGGVSKETESKLAGIIAEKGYAVLTIDQRGIGQTGGYYLSIQEDYGVFSKGFEPIQYLSVYDVLRTYDVLKQVKKVDSNNIIIIGESMGGRYATIATALDNRIKGLILISSSGFNIQYNSSEEYNGFLLSIDPDQYIKKISPRPVVMIHNINDTIIPIQNAKITYTKAKEPKVFYVVSDKDCTHGYCDAMYEYLVKSLKELLKK